MNENGIRIAAASPSMQLLDTRKNAAAIVAAIDRAKSISVDFIIFPVECITGLSLGDIRSCDTVKRCESESIKAIAKALEGSNLTAYFVTGERTGSDKKHFKAYAMNCVSSAALESNTGLLPSAAVLDAYGLCEGISLNNRERLLFASTDRGARSYSEHMLLDALKDASKRACAAMAFASPNIGESSTYELYDSLCAIVCNGEVLAKSEPFCEDAFVYADVDIFALSADEDYVSTMPVARTSYLSDKASTMADECARIVSMQAYALKRRAEHIGSCGFVIGLSGGLDSALALIASVEAAKLMRLPIDKAVLAVGMPGFGSTGRTKNNAKLLAQALDAGYKEIPIAAAVRQLFNDIGFDEDRRGITYENAQARERTLILLSISNMNNLLDVGTGDLSEAALGFTTFGGDHLAQYAVNASLPKTVIREVVRAYSLTHEEARPVLLDILATPVSPELLPPVEGESAQRTEEILGDYALHDLFIYNFVNYGDNVATLYSKARKAYPNFGAEAVKNALEVFIKRFFSQAFKRNCAPEGPNILLSIAPRFFSIPSDLKNDDFYREFLELNLN